MVPSGFGWVPGGFRVVSSGSGRVPGGCGRFRQVAGGFCVLHTPFRGIAVSLLRPVIGSNFEIE